MKNMAECRLQKWPQFFMCLPATGRTCFPAPWTWAVLVACLSGEVWQKGCCVSSELRSLRALQLLLSLSCCNVRNSRPPCAYHGPGRCAEIRRVFWSSFLPGKCSVFTRHEGLSNWRFQNFLKKDEVNTGSQNAVHDMLGCIY